jgi:hypothetical protein
MAVEASARVLQVPVSAGAGGAGAGLSSWLGLSGGGGGGGAAAGGGEAPPAAVTVGVFSPAVVENGYTAAVSRLHSALALPAAAAPLAVHFGWSGRSKEARLHRMREAKW